MNTYKMTLEDSVDSMTFDLLEVPIVDKDVEGAVDNTTLDGNIFTDYLWLKKNYVQKWSIMCDDEYSRLRGFYTRQFDNASVPTYKLFYGENISEDRAISGDYVLVDNTTDRNAPITSFELLGDAEQTTYSGKNLLGVPELYYTGVNWYNLTEGTTIPAQTTSTTATQTSNGFTINVATAWHGAIFLAPVTAGQTYHIKINASGTGCRSSLYWLDTDKKILRKGEVLNTNPLSLETNLAINSGEAYIALALGSNSATTLSVTEPQLELGSTATAYEPYVGGTASPNPDYPQEVNTVTGEQTVELVGKNILSANDGTYSSSGITGVVSNGELTLNGTSTAISGYPFGTYRLIPAGTYTLSANNPTSETGTSLLRLTDLNGISPSSRACSLNSANATKTFTLTEDTWLAYQWRFDSGKTLTNFTIKPQLELGSTATTYEPYQGQELKVNLGKNLADPNNANIINAYIRQAGITAEASNRLVYYKVEQNSYYTISATRVPASGKESVADNMQVALCSDVPANGVATYDIQQSANLYDTTLHASFTVYTGSHTYLAFKYANATNTNASATLATIQLERGSQATTYAPYFTPIELAKVGNYQDKIYKTEGKWYVEKQVGKVAININGYNSSYTNVDYAIFDKPTDALNYDTYSVMPALCESAVSPETTGGYNQTAQIGRLCSQANKTHLWIGVAKGTTQATAKTMLDGKSVYYALATPYDTEITNSALVAQLEAILQAYLYTGTNNVSNNAVSPNLAGQMNIGYKLIFSEETVLIEPTAVRLTLTDGGIINVCGCRQNVQLTMRETIQ